jgi:hypothetical protein
MSFFNYLLISVLLLGSETPERAPLPTGLCPSMEIKYSIEQLQSGQYSVSVNPKGGKAPYIVMMASESGQLVSEDFTKSKFENLGKGKYTCIVVDKVRCVMKTEIQVP